MYHCDIYRGWTRNTYRGQKRKGGGGRNYTFCPICMKNRCRNTTLSSFLLKYRGRNTRSLRFHTWGCSSVAENIPYFRENFIIPGTRSGPTLKSLPILGKLAFQNRPCRAPSHLPKSSINDVTNMVKKLVTKYGQPERMKWRSYVTPCSKDDQISSFLPWAP